MNGREYSLRSNLRSHRVVDVEHKLNLKKSYIICPNSECQREVADAQALKGEIVDYVFRPVGSHCRPSVKFDNNIKWLNTPEIAEAKEQIVSKGYKVLFL